MGQRPVSLFTAANLRGEGDIDIAFIGSSHILHCLDARRLQTELSRKLGRPATVRVLGWGGAGYDALYFIAKDFLAHRRVRMLVFYDDHNGSYRNNKSPVWFRFREDAEVLVGLPICEQAYFYFASLVGMPRNLLSLLRSNRSADMQVRNYWEEHYRSLSPVDNLGSTTSELGYDSRPNGDVDATAPFAPFSPTNGIGAADTCLYAPGSAPGFKFSNNILPAWEVHFMHLLAALAVQHNCRLVMMNIPDLLGNFRAEQIEERAYWPAIFGPNLVMLGVPPAKFFKGLPDDEVRKLFNNPGHLNKNGQAYFTSLILPSLLEIYESSPRY